MAGKKTIWDVMLNIGGKDAGAAKAFKNVKNQIKDVQNATKQLGSDFKAFAGSAAKLAVGAAGAIAAVTAGVLKGVDDVASRGDRIYDISKQLGIGVEAYQELSYAMQISGLEAADFDAALKKYNLTIAQAAAGNEKAAKALEKFGLSGKKMAQFSPEENLHMLADYFKDLPTDAARTTAAVALFGKQAGPKMAAAMKEGSAGLELLRAEARRTGNVLTQAEAELGDKYMDAKKKMTDTFEGIKTQFFVGSIDAVTRAFGNISDETSNMLPYVRELGDRFGTWLADLVTRMPEIIARIKEFAATVRENVNHVVELAGGWENVGKILAGLIVAPTAIKGARTLVSLLGLIKSVVVFLPSLFGALAAAALPVIGIIAAIAAVAYVVYKNWDKIKAKGIEAFEKIKAAAQPIIDMLTRFWQEHGETVIKVLQSVGDFIMSVIMVAIDFVVAIITYGVNVVIGVVRMIAGAFDLVFDFIITTVQFFVALFTGDIQGAADLATGFFSRFGEHVNQIFTGFMEVIAGVVGYFGDLFGAVFDFVGGLLTSLGERWGGVFGEAMATATSVIDKIKSVISGFFDKAKSIILGIPDVFSNAFNRAKEIVTGVLDYLMGPLNKVKSAIEGILGGSKNVAAVNIPVTATGGIFNKPQVRVIAEAGAEGVIPYTRPEGFKLWQQVGKLGGYFDRQAGPQGAPGEPGEPGLPGRPYEMPDVVQAAAGNVTRGGDTYTMSAPINIKIYGTADAGTIEKIKQAGQQAAQSMDDWLEARTQKKRRVSYA